MISIQVMRAPGPPRANSLQNSLQMPAATLPPMHRFGLPNPHLHWYGQRDYLLPQSDSLSVAAFMTTGHIPYLLRHDYHIQALEWANKYGGICRFSLGGQHIILVSGGTKHAAAATCGQQLIKLPYAGPPAVPACCRHHLSPALLVCGRWTQQQSMNRAQYRQTMASPALLPLTKFWAF